MMFGSLPNSAGGILTNLHIVMGAHIVGKIFYQHVVRRV